MLDAMQPVAELMDRCEAGAPYASAIAAERKAVENPDLTPSARMLAEMRERGESFAAFALRKSIEHRDAQRIEALDQLTEQRMHETARQSLANQRAVEAAGTIDFDAYLERYFAQTLEDRKLEDEDSA